MDIELQFLSNTFGIYYFMKNFLGISCQQKRPQYSS